MIEYLKYLPGAVLVVGLLVLSTMDRLAVRKYKRNRYRQHILDVVNAHTNGDKYNEELWPSSDPITARKIKALDICHFQGVLSQVDIRPYLQDLVIEGKLNSTVITNEFKRPESAYFADPT